MKELKVAVVGCGYWAPNIVRNLVAFKGVQLVALCDVDAKRAEDLADRLASNARVVSDHRVLMNDPSIDAVFIVTPVRTHFALARDFLAAGKHVFVEKPLASTVVECEELIQVAEKQHVALMVGHVFEYNSAVTWIKDYMKSGELGRILYVYSQRVNLGRVQRDVNALWSFAPHDISILNHWLDAEPEWVSARGMKCLGTAVEDVVFVMLGYPGGVTVHLHLGWIDPRKIRQMTIVGSKKMIVYDDVSQDARIQIYDKGVSGFHEYLQAPASYAEFRLETRVGDLVVPTLKFGEPLQEELRHFLASVREGKRPRTDGMNGMRVVKVLQAAQRSLEMDGETIRLT